MAGTFLEGSEKSDGIELTFRAVQAGQTFTLMDGTTLSELTDIIYLKAGLSAVIHVVSFTTGGLITFNKLMFDTGFVPHGDACKDGDQFCKSVPIKHEFKLCAYDMNGEDRCDSTRILSIPGYYRLDLSEAACDGIIEDMAIYVEIHNNSDLALIPSKFFIGDK